MSLYFNKKYLLLSQQLEVNGQPEKAVPAKLSTCRLDLPKTSSLSHDTTFKVPRLGKFVMSTGQYLVLVGGVVALITPGYCTIKMKIYCIQSCNWTYGSHN